MKIYDKCPGCDESVLGRKPVTMFECRSWIGLDGVLTETNTCLRRQLTQSQAQEQKLKTALAVIEISFAAMQERAEAAERDRDGWKKCSNDLRKDTSAVLAEAEGDKA